MLANLILILIFQIYLARLALALHPAVAHTNSDLCCLWGNQDSVKAAIQDALNICHKFASAALTSVNKKKLWMCGTRTILSSAARLHHHTRLAPQVQKALVIKIHTATIIQPYFTVNKYLHTSGAVGRQEAEHSSNTKYISWIKHVLGRS